MLPKRGAAAAKKALKALLFELRSDAITALVPALAASVLAWADERKREGALLFHDLLVLARDALRNADVRVACHAAYERVLIDEFQDTDPLQIEIAVLLASPDPDVASPIGATTRCCPTRGGCSSSATPSSRSTGSAGPTSSCTGTRKRCSPTRRATSRRTSARSSRS